MPLCPSCPHHHVITHLPFSWERLGTVCVAPAATSPGLVAAAPPGTLPSQEEKGTTEDEMVGWHH